MFNRGIRGAITIRENTSEDIKNGVKELLSEIFNKNDFKIEDITFCIFTMTKDLNATYPAKCARELFNLNFVPFMCFSEMDIENSLNKCLRVLFVINTIKKPEEIKHVYLKGAKVLRPDIK